MEERKHKSITIRHLRSGVLASPSGRVTVDGVCEALPCLNAYGYRSIYCTYAMQEHQRLRDELVEYPTYGSTSGRMMIGPDAFRQLQCWVRAFQPSHRWTQMHSYGLNHVFERETGIYVPDGVFILGALMAGFVPKFPKDSPTAIFRMWRPAVR